MGKSYNNNHLVKWYLWIWAIYFLLLFITPGSSLESTHNLGLFYTISYVITSAGVATFLNLVAPTVRWQRVGTELRHQCFYYDLQPHRLMLWINAMVLIGFGLHIYDKAFILPIDFTQGIASARFQWIRLGAERQDVISSWQSAAGHILANFYFVSILLSFVFWENLPKFKRAISLIIGLVVMLAYSATMANRSVPLVFIAFCGALMLLRRILGKTALPISTIAKAISVLLAFLFVAYALYVFSDRAQLTGSNIKDYAQSFFLQLGGRETATFDYGDSLPEPLRDIFYLVVLTILYIVHTQWTFDMVLTLTDTPGGSLLNTIYAGLTRIGLESIASYNDDRAFKGVLLSLPGSAWYDFGLIGMYLVAIFHGFLIYLSNQLLLGNNARVTFGAVFLFIVVAVFSLISPLTSVANLMVFPFLIMSLGSIPLMSVIARYASHRCRHVAPAKSHNRTDRLPEPQPPI